MNDRNANWNNPGNTDYFHILLQRNYLKSILLLCKFVATDELIDKTI
jgi:hypothetical protein